MTLAPKARKKSYARTLQRNIIDVLTWLAELQVVDTKILPLKLNELLTSFPVQHKATKEGTKTINSPKPKAIISIHKPRKATS